MTSYRGTRVSFIHPYLRVLTSKEITMHSDLHYFLHYFIYLYNYVSFHFAALNISMSFINNQGIWVPMGNV